MRTFLVIISSLCLFVLLSHRPGDENTAVEVMNLSNEALAQCENFTYSASVIIRIPSGDSIRSTAECWIKKMPRDTLFGYYVRIIENMRVVRIDDKKYPTQDGIIEHLYSGENIYYIIHSAKKVLANIPINAKRFTSLNTESDYIPVDLLMGYSIDGSAVSPEQVSLDSIANEYWVLRIESKRRDEVIERYKQIWIDKNSRLPFKFFSRTEKKDGDIWTTTLEINDLVVNKDNETIDNLLSESNIPSNYELEYPKPPGSEPALPELEFGTSAPAFSLVTFDEDSITLFDLRGEMVLLDFWYINCYPCQLAIPDLNRLDSLYNSKGLNVLGLNYHDRKMERINDYVRRKKIGYTIVKSDKQTAADYKVQGYPTFYLIDREGKIRYSEIGYDEASFDSLEAIIRSEL